MSIKNAKYEDKICVCCGKTIPKAHHKTMYCDECKDIYQRKTQKEYQTEYRERKRAEKAKYAPPKPQEKTTDKFCRGCIYFDYYKCCNYFLVTGKHRPCPPGKGCTEKKKRRCV